MQLFPCPFCGPRDESEYHYSGEAGNARPDGSDTPIAGWFEYLYFRNNPKGASREVWLHLTCHEYFVMERDSLTHQVMRSYPINQPDNLS